MWRASRSLSRLFIALWVELRAIGRRYFLLHRLVRSNRSRTGNSGAGSINSFNQIKSSRDNSGSVSKSCTSLSSAVRNSQLQAKKSPFNQPGYRQQAMPVYCRYYTKYHKPCLCWCLQTEVPPSYICPSIFPNSVSLPSHLPSGRRARPPRQGGKSSSAHTNNNSPLQRWRRGSHARQEAMAMHVP